MQRRTFLIAVAIALGDGFDWLIIKGYGDDALLFEQPGLFGIECCG